MPTTDDLFADSTPAAPEQIAEGAWLLRGFVLSDADRLLDAISQVASQAPFRHQITPGGYSMSAAMSSCGEWGWVTDRQGYRYSTKDPLTDQPWPAMPDLLRQVAIDAAAASGYEGFNPDACLINRYETGAKMGLHQDKDEADFSAPIVSISLGAPITFMFGGLARTDKTSRWKLEHGDVVVWGGKSRLFFHGVAPLGKRSEHPQTGPMRYNLTFRKVT
ncbi:DNA oxidative demethylase AlkB [Halopseudomonas pelagia]|uniref:DNA oxidative demethylase AlkB n=1 Tax=Halopseudomonas pelagia TaxID=553151 RepID=A0AA91TZ02_9GAMM|nr:DNA oxidative demethylase AlkB [Halopseudomonas pelagia]PCC97417.1 DNA oxidative demethylase AlkB [Halopseudomonas pelagia]QFY57732.1 DNA oxidative demethylase AlkB [Halopseudomonas pelagia]